MGKTISRECESGLLKIAAATGLDKWFETFRCAHVVLVHNRKLGYYMTIEEALAEWPAEVLAGLVKYEELDGLERAAIREFLSNKEERHGMVG